MLYCYYYSNLLETRVVDANVIIDKHYLSPVLVRACEEGKVEFVEPLFKYGTNVYESKTLTQVSIKTMQNVPI